MNHKFTCRHILKNLFLAFFISLAVIACSKKQAVKGDGEATGTYDVSEDDIRSGKADSDSDNAMGLKTIYFPFDSFELNSESLSAIKKNYGILKENSSLKIQIEGHCDERGGIQYNLALGEKRANAVRKKLVSMGISGSRIETISYGKEKPVALGHSESDFSQNRRGNFVITSK